MITRNCFKYLPGIIQLPDDIMIGSLLCLAARPDDEELTGSVSEHLLATAQCTVHIRLQLQCVGAAGAPVCTLYCIAADRDEPTYSQSNM